MIHTPYSVEDTLWVDSLATLTIKEGVTVQTERSWLYSVQIVIKPLGTLTASGTTFTGNTDIVVNSGGTLELANEYSVSGNQVVFQHGSHGSVTGNQFESAVLGVHSGMVAVSDNAFSTDEPIETDPTLVPEFYDNTFQNSATVLVSGTVPTGTDSAWYSIALAVPVLVYLPSQGSTGKPGNKSLQN